MNKTSFKNLIAALALTTICFSAKAETVFMLQLGSFDSEKKAATHWSNLAKTFPELFEELKYSPSEIVNRPDNFVSYRTQAGPVPTREEAENICGELISSGYECGVSETAMFYGDSQEIEQSSANAKAETPAKSASQTTAIVPFAPESNAAKPPAVAPLQPQPLNAPLPSQNVSEAPVASNNMQQGTIAAEEAIPVPLSNNAPTTNPYLERGNRLLGAHPNDSARINSFWADIGYFKNEVAAAQYVRTLKSRDPLLPSNLRIRITRPYGVITGREQLSLRMGPFVTTRPILRLCGLTRSENLRCRAVKDFGGSIRGVDRYSLRRNYNETRGFTRGYSHSQGYNNRSTNSLNAQYSNIKAGNNLSNNSHFVQLGSFLSPDAANAKWQQLKSRHGYIMQNVNNDVVLPASGSSASRLFRLRAGPFADGNAAYNFCSQLKSSGTLCVVTR
jgi:hypothetical protein